MERWGKGEGEEEGLPSALNMLVGRRTGAKARGPYLGCMFCAATAPGESGSALESEAGGEGATAMRMSDTRDQYRFMCKATKRGEIKVKGDVKGGPRSTAAGNTPKSA